jgi:hypothetical protein
MPAIRDELATSFGRPLVERWMRDRLASLRSRRQIYSDITHRDVISWANAAEMFYVTAPMSAVIAQAANAVPPYRLRPDDLPARTGLVVFADPPVATDHVQALGEHAECSHEGHTARCEVRGVLWSAGVDPRYGPCVWVNFLLDTEVLLASPHYQSHAPAETLKKMRADLGPFALADTAPLTFGDDPDVKVVNEDVAMILATWLLMGQRISRTTIERPTRQVRRYFERAGRPEPLVRSVTLRRASSAACQDRAEGQAPVREYHHQWIVGGHWRNHWYPSESRHKPVYIADYVKGPEGAPLIGGERVSVLRR